MKYSFTICFALITQLLVFGLAALAQTDTIKPTQIWPDAMGNRIHAHGGGIIKVKNNYYWYGEERRQGLDTNYRYVSCYLSKDLVNWTFKGDILQITKPDAVLSKWVVERPKVFYNQQTKKFVMYKHVDGQVKGTSSRVTLNIKTGEAKIIPGLK